MKRRMTALLLTAALLLGMVPAAGAAEDEPAPAAVTASDQWVELITNGSFESGNTGWSGLDSAGKTVAVEAGPYGSYVSSAAPGGGSNVCELNSNGALQTVYQVVNVVPGGTLVVNAFYSKRTKPNPGTESMQIAVMPATTAITRANLEAAAIPTYVRTNEAATCGTDHKTLTAGNGWAMVGGGYEVPSSCSQVVVAFLSMAPASGGSGNIIDMVSAKEMPAGGAFFSTEELQNPGFEQLFRPMEPRNWMSPQYADSKVLQTSAAKRSGSAGASLPASQSVFQMLSAAEGQTFQVSLWVINTDGSTPNVEVQMGPPEKNVRVSAASHWLRLYENMIFGLSTTSALTMTNAGTENGWTHLTGSYTFAGNANAPDYLLFRIVNNGTATLYVDDVGVVSKQVYVSSSGNDTTGDGTRERPVKTLAKAVGMVTDGGTVCVMNDLTEPRSNLAVAKDVTITTDPQKTGGSAVITSTGTSSVVIISGGKTLTLQNIIFDGSSQGSSAPFIVGPAEPTSGPASSGRLVLGSGAVLRNFTSNYGAVWTNTHAENQVTIQDGATISGNQSSYVSGSTYAPGNGGGVTLRGGTLTMTGGTISGNTAANGGGVAVLNSAKCVMTGGTINKNTASSAGGGVYSTVPAANVKVGGSLKIEGNTCTAGDDKAALYSTLTSGPAFTLGANLTGKIYAMRAGDGGGDNGAVIATSSGAYTGVENIGKAGEGTVHGAYKSGASGEIVWTRDASTPVYVSASGSDSKGDGTYAKPYATLNTAYAQVKDGGTIYVMDNLTGISADGNASASFTQNKAVTLTTTDKDQNGTPYTGERATITQTGVGRLLHVKSGSSVTVKNLTLTQAQNINSQYSVIHVEDGQLTLDDGAVITGIHSIYGGVLLWTAGANVVMKAGSKITGNFGTNNGYGGGVSVNAGKLVMEGGEISGNTSIGNGGGIALLGGTLRLDGSASPVVITGNKVPTGGQGGGVYSKVAAANLEVRGNVTLAGNCPDRTTLTGHEELYSTVAGAAFTLTGDLTGAVYAMRNSGGWVAGRDGKDLSGASAIATANGTWKGAENIVKIGDTGARGAYRSGNTGEVVWLAQTGAYVSSKGDDTTGAGTPSRPYATLAKAYGNVPDGGTIYVMDDLTLPGVTADNAAVSFNEAKSVTLTTTDVNRDGSAHSGPVTISRGAGTGQGYHLLTISNGTVTVKDLILRQTESTTNSAAGVALWQGGKLVLNKDAAITGMQSSNGAVYVAEGSTESVLTLNTGSKITGNTATSTASNVGGGVTLLNGKLEMNGGEISGNTAASGAGGVYAASGTTVTLGGDAVITGNTVGGDASNLYLSTATQLTLNGAFTGAAGVTDGWTDATNRGGETFGTAVTGASGAEKLTNDVTGAAGFVSGGSLEWADSVTAKITALYSYSQGNGVTAAFQVTLDTAPTGTPSVQVTDSSGKAVGTAAIQGEYHGGNYVVTVTGLAAGQAYTVRATVGGQAVGGELSSWQAPAATSGSGNTSGYWSSGKETTKTDGSGNPQVVSGIAYSVKDDRRIDVQGYGQVRTTFANAGWTVRTDKDGVQVWAVPTIVTGDSGADYVQITYYVRNNTDEAITGLNLGASSDIMIGSNDRAPVYREDYGIRTAVSDGEDALSFAIITQKGGGVAQYADTVSSRWFGPYYLRGANTFTNTSTQSLTGVDSGAAFSWQGIALGVGEVQEYSVVIGVAGKDDQEKDITKPEADPGTVSPSGDTPSGSTQKLSAPEATATSDSITISTVAGQTYILRLSTDGESYMTCEGTGNPYKFEGLSPSTTYYVYTKMTEQDAEANPYRTDSDNTTAITSATQAGTAQGTFDLKQAVPTSGSASTNPEDALTAAGGALTYFFPEAEATLTNGDSFQNLSVMVDTGSFTLSSVPAGCTVSGVNANGGYVDGADTNTAYTYLIFTGSFTQEQAEAFVRGITFQTEDYGVKQRVDVDADAIDLPAGVARLGSSYYRYVANRGITWNSAYQAAKASSFNGLPGYLITVESAVEHNFVYQNYGGGNGWMGGVRTNALDFDGPAFDASANPGTGAVWKWVCGPSAGETFWNGYNTAGTVPDGMYANWKPNEPNNYGGAEWAALYGYGSGGLWNDYRPNNSAAGGYYVEYTAYKDYQAASPMAHDDKTNFFTPVDAVARILSGGAAVGTTTYPTLAAAVAAYTGSETQVIQMIADTTEDAVTINQIVYLDLNGHTVNAAITVSDGGTLYGLDSTTNGYADAAYGHITGTVTGTVGSVTKTTKAHFPARAMNYLPVQETEGLSFHRFNVQVAKYHFSLNTTDGTATLIFYPALQGDSQVVSALTAFGAGAKLAENDKYVTSESPDVSNVPRPSDPYYYEVDLINLNDTGAVNGFTTNYDLIGILKFGNVTFESESRRRSFLQILKLYYNGSATAEEKAAIDTFIEANSLNTEWGNLK